MQKFSGIYMGRRKKQASETEADMEGLGDDIEPHGLAFLAHEFHKSINQTESKLVIHLQENYEANCKGQTEITKTLRKVDGNPRKVDENQTRIYKLWVSEVCAPTNPTSPKPKLRFSVRFTAYNHLCVDSAARIHPSSCVSPSTIGLI
jgi:hypothetical protein